MAELDWKPQHPDLITRNRGSIARTGSVGPLFLPLLPQTSIAWLPKYPDKISRPVDINRFLGSNREPVFIQRPDLSFLPSYPNQHLRKKNPNDYVGEVKWSQGNIPAILSWQPKYPDIIWRKRQTRIGHTQTVTGLDKFPVPALSWKPQYPDRIVRKERAREGASKTIEALSGFTYVDAWRIGYPNQHLRKKDTNKYTGTSTFVHTIAPTISWYPTFPAIVRGLSKLSYLGQSVSIEHLTALPVPPLSWLGTYPPRVDKKKQTQTGITTSVLGQNDFEVPPLSWNAFYQTNPFRKNTRNYLNSAVSLPGSLPVIPLSWKAQYPDLLFTKKRLNSGDLRFLTTVSKLPVPNLSWLPIYPSFIFKHVKAREGFIEAIKAIANFGVPPLSWNPRYPNPLKTRRVAFNIDHTKPVFVPPPPPLTTEIPWLPVYPSYLFRKPHTHENPPRFREIIIVEPIISNFGSIKMSFRITFRLRRQ